MSFLDYLGIKDSYVGEKPVTVVGPTAPKKPASVGIPLPTISWQIPVTPSKTLNDAAGASNKNTVQCAAAYATIRVIYGTVRVPAQIANVIDWNGNWVIQSIWGEGPINGVSDILFGDVAATGSVTHYQGTSTQNVDPWLSAAFTAKGLSYPDNLRGIAYSVFLIPGGDGVSMPSITAKIRGRSVYDPRTGTSYFTDTPALILADFITNTLYGRGRPVRQSTVTTVANLNEALVGGAKRRTLNICLDAPQDSDAWVDTLATYAGCWAMPEGAEVVLVPDNDTASVADFVHSNGDILSLTGLKRRGISGLPTAIEVRYTDTSAAVWREASAWSYYPGVEAGTYPRRESQVALPGIQLPGHAAREAIERLNKLTLADLSCSMMVKDTGLKLAAGDIIRVTHPIGFTPLKKFRIQQITSDLGRHTLSLLEHDPACYSNAVATTPSSPDTTLPDPYLPPAAVTGLTLVEEIYATGDGSVASRLRCTWNAVSDMWGIRYSINVYRMNDSIGTVSFTAPVAPLEVASGYSGEPLYVVGLVENPYWYRVTIVAERIRTSVVSTAVSSTVQARGKLLPPANVTGFTASAVSSGMELAWTKVVDIDMKGYRVRSGSWSGPIVGDATATATSLNIGYTPAGTTPYYIKALDWSGNESSVATLANGVVSGPSNVTGFNWLVTVSDAVFYWNPSTGTWPIDHYEIRYGASWAAGTAVATLNSTDYHYKADWAGARTFWIVAYDKGGNASTPVSRVATIVKFAPVPTLNVVVNGTDLVFTWSAATGGSLMLDCYEIRVGSTFDAAATLGTSATTGFTIPYRWNSNQTFWVAPKDMAGNYSSGTESSQVVVFNAPAAPVVTAKVIGLKVELTWNTPTATLPIKQYSVRYGASWAAGAATEVILSVTNTRLPIDWLVGANPRNYFVLAYDANGNPGTASTATPVTIAAPSAPALNNTLTTVGGAILGDYKLIWTPNTVSATQLPIDYYEVSYTGAPNILGKTPDSVYQAAANWAGAREFSVRAVDLLGNIGATSLITLTVNPPLLTTPSLFYSKVIENVVTLYWSGFTSTLQPLTSYRLKRGPIGSDWNTAIDLGPKSGGFTTVTESTAGSYVYWLAGVDVAGNEGTPVSTTASVSSPPGYVLAIQYTSTFNGTATNSMLDVDGGRIFGVDLVETWASHFTSRGWSTINDQLTASGGIYPMFLQPGALPSTYTETFPDYGVPLPGTTVTLDIAGTIISGTPVITPTIATSPDGTTWNSIANVWSVFDTGFRYVRVSFTVTGGQYKMTQMKVTLDSKLRNDGGVVSALATDTYGTIVNFNIPFIDVQPISLTAMSGTPNVPVSALYDFLDSYVAGTYTVSANVCTVNTGGSPHSLAVGQRTILTPSSGGGVKGVYTVTSIVGTDPDTSTQFTVNMTTANTSGNLTSYAQGFRVYVLNSATGAPVSRTVSWSVGGY